MKKIGLFLGLLVLSLLVACGSEDLSEYVDVSFSGVDSIGQVNYSVDEEALLSDLFDYDSNTDPSDTKVIENISSVLSAYSIKFDNTENLSNGDKVTMTIEVDKDKTKKVKGGEVEFTVKDLEDAKDIMPFIEVSFSGLDTQGKAEYEMNHDALIDDLFGYDGYNDKTQAHLDDLETAYTIELEPEDGLSNGDTVTATVNVDDSKSKLIKSTEQTFTVEDLGEATTLTTEDAEKHLVLNFNGVSGKGEAQMDNTFSSPLDYFNFEIENDGALSNGDKATLVWNEETEQSLNNEGYIAGEDFNPTFEVEGLDVVAENATDIANLEDVERLIEEEVNRRFSDNNPDETYGIRYEIELEKLMYRQFNDEDDNWYGKPDHGHLIGIYSVGKYDGGKDGDLIDEFTAIEGFSNIYLDEDNKTNVSKIDGFWERKDDSYSLKSVIQLYEGNGYEEVEK